MIFQCPCVFSNGESTDVYKICRRNKQSLDRHSLRRHLGKKANVRPFNDKDELVSKARETFHKWFKEKNNSMASSLKKSTRMKNANVKKTALAEEEQSAPKPVVHTMFSLQKNARIENSKTTSEQIIINDQSRASHKENESDQHSLLHQKIDALVSEFREFRIQSMCEKNTTTNHPLWAAHPKCASEVSELLLKWPEIKNVIDIVNSSSHIRFFAGNEKEGVL